jgi:AAA family ATP:ADP antiporter
MPGGGGGLLGRVTQARPGEERALAWSFTCLFALLCSYSILRPLRDALGLAWGARNVQWLFSATFVLALLVVPLLGRALSCAPRKILLPSIYRFFLSHLAIFFVLFRAGVGSSFRVPAFFIWLGVFNLLAVSVFWSLMADVFNQEQAKRLFGSIASGGSAGALTGPLLTATLATRLGPASLILLSGGFLLLATVSMNELVALGPAASGAFPGASRARAECQIPFRPKSPSLLGVGLLIAGYTTVSTLLYCQQAEIVLARMASPAERTAFLASVDLAVSATTLLVQVFLTGRLMRRCGLALTLPAVPLLVSAGFLALAALPGLPLLVTVVVIHRAGSLALLRPSREVLFTNLGPGRRIKAKTFLDTVVYRGSDAIGAWFFALMRSAALGPQCVAAAGVPIALLWAFTGFVLGRRHEQGCPDRGGAGRSARATPPRPESAAGVGASERVERGPLWNAFS